MHLQRKALTTSRNNSLYVMAAAGVLALVAAYYVLFRFWGIGLHCFWYDLTGLYRPGCGVTRMLAALMEGNIYQAWRYNPLVLILLPLGILGLIDSAYHKSKNEKSVLDKAPGWVWVVLIVITIGYGICRNLPMFSFLAPTVVMEL